MDMSDTIAPNSEQLNAEDLLAGAVVVTITSVEKGTNDQPVFIHTAEYPGRTYRPAKSMRRVMVAAWGIHADEYVGRRMQLFNDPSVKWAGKPVGGIRISALSHISEPLQVALTVARGKREPWIVQPLKAGDALEPHRSALTAATTMQELQAAGEAAGKAGVTGVQQVIELKDARKVELAEVVEDGQQG